MLVCILLVTHVYTAGQRGRTYVHARQQDTPTKQSADNHVMLTWSAKINYEIDWKIDYKIDWKIAYRVEKSPIVLAAEKE